MSAPTITQAVDVIFVIPHAHTGLAPYSRVFIGNESLFRMRVDELRPDVTSTKSHALLYHLDLDADWSVERIISYIEDTIVEADRPPFDPIETLN